VVLEYSSVHLVKQPRRTSEGHSGHRRDKGPAYSALTPTTNQRLHLIDQSDVGCIFRSLNKKNVCALQWSYIPYIMAEYSQSGDSFASLFHTADLDPALSTLFSSSVSYLLSTLTMFRLIVVGRSNKKGKTKSG
jgi:hypothetical protein